MRRMETGWRYGRQTACTRKSCLRYRKSIHEKVVNSDRACETASQMKRFAIVARATAVCDLS